MGMKRSYITSPYLRKDGSMFANHKTVEEVLESKMSERFSVGGVRQEECDLLDEWYGEDRRAYALNSSNTLRSQPIS